MNKTQLTTLIAALMMACGGGSNGNDELDGKEIGGGADLTADVGPLDLGTRDGEPDGTDVEPEPEAVSELPGEDSAPAAPVISDELIAALCADYCNAAHECPGIEYGDGCVEECTSLMVDEAFVKKMICAHGDSDDGDDGFCDKFDSCPDDYPILAGCEEACAAAELCNAFVGPILGWSLNDCELLCSAHLGLAGETGQEMLACILPALEQCSGTQFLGCVAAGEFEPVCEPLFCSEEIPAECALVPDVYADQAACLEVCEEWAVGPTLAAKICAQMSANLPVDCKDSLASCIQMPTTLPAGAIDYCKGYSEKCGGLGNMEMQLGDLEHDLCAWQVTGMVQTRPEAFITFVEATACLDELPMCLTGNLATLYCLLKVDEEAKTKCAKVKDICLEAQAAQELLYECQAAFGFAAGFVPEFLPMIEACLDNASNCLDLEQCFFPDDDEEGGE